MDQHANETIKKAFDITNWQRHFKQRIWSANFMRISQQNYVHRIIYTSTSTSKKNIQKYMFTFPDIKI